MPELVDVLVTLLAVVLLYAAVLLVVLLFGILARAIYRKVNARRGRGMVGR